MPNDDLLILKWLLTTRPENISGDFKSVADWKKNHANQLLAWTEPVDLAIAGGFLSDCPAYAFAAGYWAALYRLLPDLPRTPLPALCISEKHGPHPGKIKCRLDRDKTVGWRLNGKKHFVTCGREAELLIVAASTGTSAEGQNKLHLVMVDRAQVGISVKPLEKPLAILPEISHGAVVFSDVTVPGTDFLPGDGYTTYIKPFRTIEDLHIMAAMGGYLLRIGTLFGWPHAAREQLLALLMTLRALARADYTAPAIHIAAGGAITALRSLLESIESCWDLVCSQTRHTWQRDRSVLDIAADARNRRLTVAWQVFA